MTHDGMPYDPI